MNIKTTILSWLLHHANRYFKSEYFYSLKKELLAKHGKHLGYDVQFIEGQECWSCGGTGVYVGYYGLDTCYKCCNGMYKRPEWNILEVISFGKYTFHQPWKRVNEKPEIVTRQTIEGYISHNSTYWSLFARCILYLLYRRKEYGDKWDFQLKRNAYRCYWFKHFPYNFLTNLISTIYGGKNSYFYKFKILPIILKINPKKYDKNNVEIDADSLPF